MRKLILVALAVLALAASTATAAEYHIPEFHACRNQRYLRTETIYETDRSDYYRNGRWVGSSTIERPIAIRQSIVTRRVCPPPTLHIYGR